MLSTTELIEAVALEGDVPRTTARNIVKATFSAIVTAVKNGDTVQLTEFGVFGPKDKPATTGRNPRTGEAIAIPARRVVKFRPAKGFNAALN